MKPTQAEWSSRNYIDHHHDGEEFEQNRRLGGLAGRAELLTRIEGASSRPVRRIVLRAG